MSDKIVTPVITKLDFRAKEAINALRGNIQMAGYHVKTIAVTSARANEGKLRIPVSFCRMNCWNSS